MAPRGFELSRDLILYADNKKQRYGAGKVLLLAKAARASVAWSDNHRRETPTEHIQLTLCVT